MLIQFHLLVRAQFSAVLPVLSLAAFKFSVKTVIEFLRDSQNRALQSHIMEIWNIYTAGEMLR